MPGLNYANPSLLAQFTPGEVSPDQAVPNYYYIDLNPDTFALRDAYGVNVSFWDSVADKLKVGNKITCVGHGGSDPYPLAVTTATIIIQSIEPAPPGSKYHLRVKRGIGPESFYMNQYLGVPGLNYRSMLSGEECRYRGIVELVTPPGATSTFELGIDVAGDVDLDCYCCGVILANNTSNVGNLSISFIRPTSLNPNTVTFEVTWVFQAAPPGPALQKILIKLEVYKPISNFT